MLLFLVFHTHINLTKVVKLADTLDLGSSSIVSRGSTPLFGNYLYKKFFAHLVKLVDTTDLKFVLFVGIGSIPIMSIMQGEVTVTYKAHDLKM